ncbi:hypothetical protein [Aliiruegeria sabulilitoris]|uniref:hypothetical protein n=1 Tax=Aliiruegeria sabulilitoris TaxID=1510458 RepID=UPI0008351D6A|nr:hypothetical protein [Aliiruegeria sabulilitoris]NDR55376.1 hypothetical protein [Pseudoruegeria sp. M32A2M]
MLDQIISYDGEELALGVVFALALSLLLRVRAVAIALAIGLAVAAIWAVFLAPGGPAAAVDLVAARLGTLVRSGFWLGFASASTVSHLLENTVRHARQVRANRRNR